MSGSIFDLDPAGRKALDESAQVLGVDATTPPPPSGFAGVGQAGKELLGASASAGRTLLSLPLAVTTPLDKLYGFTTWNDYYHGTTDWWSKHVVDNIGQDSVDYWTPDASQMGAASKVLGNVFHIVGSVPQMIGTPEVFLANSAFSPATDLTRQGVDAKTALEVGGISLAVNAAGFKLPAAIGNNLATRVATGVGVNEVLGTASDAATKALLESGGYDQLAEGYDWKSLKNRSLDAVMGAVFGGVGHVHAQAELRDQSVRDFLAAGNTGAAKDALMTQLNGEHFAASAMPGMPTNAGAPARAQAALSTAIGQVLRGESVNAADLIHPDDFIVRQPTAAPVDYTAYRRALESGGNAAARNPNSSAAGIDQFTEKTWLAMVDQAKPAWAEGLSKQKLLDARLDPAKSGEMADVLDHENALALRKAGVPVDNHALYAAHHFGADVAIKFAQADADTPIADILPAADIKANPYLKGKTKAQVLANWDDRAHVAGVYSPAELDAANFGQPEPPQTIADNDAFWQAVPEGEHGRETANIDTPERQALRQQLVDQHFADIPEPQRAEGEKPVAYVMGGGGASGKGTILKRLKAAGLIPEGMVEIDPDAIKTGGGAHDLTGIPEYQQMLDRGDSRAAAVVHEESSNIAKQVLARAIAGKYDLVLDRTLGDKAKGLAELQALKDAGYEVRLTGVTLDPRLAVARAVKRSVRSMRYVPLDHLLRAHKGFADAFEDYARLVDHAQLFDNGVGQGEDARLLAVKAGEALEVTHPEGYNSFRGRSQINDQATTLRELETQAAPPAGERMGQRSAEGAGGPEGNAGSDRGTGPRGSAADAEAAQSGQTEPLMQNRDRGRAASVAQMQSIANHPDAQRLGFSRDPNTGAPMVSAKDAAQAVPAADLGREDVVVMASGRRIPIRYAVVEAGDVTASHNADGTPNPGYVDATLRALNNGRVAGVQAAWAHGNGESYKAGLIDEASLVGIKPEAIASKREPMLIRLYDDARNTGDMGAESNASSNLGLSPTEQAYTDARALPDLTHLPITETGELSTNPAADFYRQFLANLGSNEAAKLVDGEGRPNKTFFDRLRAAIFAHAYGNDRMVAAMAEDAHPDARNVLHALVKAAPEWAKVDPTGPLGSYAQRIAAAFDVLRAARESGHTVEAFQRQGSLIDRDTRGDAWAQFFANNARSVNRMADALREAGKLVTKAQQQLANSDMFGAEPPTVADVTQRAIGLVENPDAAAQQPTRPGNLFTAAGRPAREARPSTDTEGRGSGEREAGQRTAAGGERTGQGEARAVTPEESIAANIAAQVPDLEITLDDGTTVNAADALREADAAIQQAEQDSRGFEAAVLCAAGYRNAE